MSRSSPLSHKRCAPKRSCLVLMGQSDFLGNILIVGGKLIVGNTAIDLQWTFFALQLLQYSLVQDNQNQSQSQLHVNNENCQVVYQSLFQSLFLKFWITLILCRTSKLFMIFLWLLWPCWTPMEIKICTVKQQMMLYVSKLLWPRYNNNILSVVIESIVIVIARIDLCQWCWAAKHWQDLQQDESK